MCRKAIKSFLNLGNPDKQKQDISALKRDTTNTLNKLGEIFDKQTVEEKQELAGLFGELAFNQIHKLKGTNAQKAAWHALVGGIMSGLTGGDFLTGASAGAVNKLLTTQLEKASNGNADLHQWLSAGLGAVVGSMTGNPSSGASVAVSGTKNNEFLRIEEVKSIGLIVNEQGTGHVGVASEDENNKLQRGDFGRFVNNTYLSSGHIVSPIGDGQYKFQNSYVFDEKKGDTIFMLNIDREFAKKILHDYNAAIKAGGFSYTEGEKEQMHKLANGVSNYNLLDNNCVTTTLSILMKNKELFNEKAQETLCKLEREYDPKTVGTLLRRDLIVYKGEGLLRYIKMGEKK